MCLGAVTDGEEVERWRRGVGEIWTERLVPYRQDARGEEGMDNEDDVYDDGGRTGNGEVVEKNDWSALTSYITPALLSRLTNNADWRVNTGSCAEQDADHIPGLSSGNAEETGFGEPELQFLGIDLKRTWREGAVGRERTEAAVDRSWALEDVEQRWKAERAGGGGDVVLGQMQVCFLMVVTLANYSCLEEWKRVLGLVLTCKRAVRVREAWFVRLLALLRRQLARGADVEGGLFDMADEGGAYLKGLLKGFKRTLGQVFGDGEGEDVREELAELEQWLKREYGWELGDSFVRRGMLELEDGEQVEMEMEEMEAEDERGEYAPVIVEL